MLPSDITAVLQWWAVLFLIGLGFLPLTFFLFSKFFDKGYLFSKILGSAITTYAIYVLGILHIFPFLQWTSYVIFALVVLVFFYVLPKKWKIIYNFKTRWLTFLLEELLFLLALFFWSYIHSFAPDIHGLEKFMDYGFLNSILRTEYFPPKDMWFTPFYINYYYFGHLVTGVLTRLSGVPSNISFNIMLSTIFAFCLSECFSLGANLYTLIKKSDRVVSSKRVVAGALTAGLVTLAGNLHIIYAFFKAYNTDNPVPPWQLPFLPLTFPNSYWYPNATRYIYHTIHEFPIYSWTVADLHGHVLDIPFVLLTIALLLALFMAYDPAEKEEEDAEETRHWYDFPFTEKIANLGRTFVINPFHLVLLGFMLSVMYMTNAWDGAIYLLLAALIFTYIHFQKLSVYEDEAFEDQPVEVVASAKHAKVAAPSKWKLLWVRDLVLSILLTTASFALFTFPYNVFFKPFVSGVGVLCASDTLTKLGKLGPLLFEANHCQHSYWWELLILYGFFYFFVFAFLYFLWRTKKALHSDTFILLLITLGTLLILIPEFIYVKDIYPAHYRANTMFKLVFQAFMILSIASGYIISRIFSYAEGNQKIFRYVVFFPITTILVILVMMYPRLAINSYYGDLKTYKGLDGTAYIKTLYPNLFDAIQWLNTNVKGQPVIVEAQGDSYTDYEMVSANTGLPTVLGWTVHEWLWRGTYDIPAPRITEVQSFYETTDANAAKDFLKKYDVKYIIVGPLEYQKYPKIDAQKFDQLGKAVFHKDNTTIYEVK